MLDPHFKALHIVESLVGYENAIKLASKYDAKVVIPLLMVCFQQLNPNIVATTTTTNDARLGLKENMFGIGVSIEESFQTLFIKELFLFKTLFISSSTCANPLTWWHMHERIGLLTHVPITSQILISNNIWN